MLNPVLLKLLQNETSSDLLFREELAQVWQKVSAHFYSYERDIKMLEHASDIANEDYERINKQLKESNEGLGLELAIDIFCSVTSVSSKEKKSIFTELILQNRFKPEKKPMKTFTD